MEQRRFPRVQIPLLVELKHPTTGTIRCMARDISEGGVFVHTDMPQLGPGAKVKLTLLNTLGVESQPTPTVDMEVKRVEESGLGLAFASVAGRYLWESVERMRTELAIGRDYFQVHVNVLVVGASRALLLAKQNGRWTFPAAFLVVGEDWQQAVRRYLKQDFGLEVDQLGPIVSMATVTGSEVPEAAVLDLFVEATAQAADCELAETSRYRATRWMDRRRQVEEATFASERVRELAADVIHRLTAEEDPP